MQLVCVVDAPYTDSSAGETYQVDVSTRTVDAVLQLRTKIQCDGPVPAIIDRAIKMEKID